MPFLTGLELSRSFYTQVLATQLTDRPHAAALLGWGSDVLGYDTPRSTDHGWGPRVQVFPSLTTGSATWTADDLVLPETFRGHPVSFGWAGVAPRTWVEVVPLGEWLVAQLGVDARADPSTLDWLLVPQQRLLGVTAGAVFYDPDGVLADVRGRLAWYPDELWRWLLACQWHRVSQEEAFVARTAEVGDATGSMVTAARQVRDLMRLALLQERRYAPYQKWLGTAFAELPDPDGLSEALAAGVRGDQLQLATASQLLATRQDASGLTPPVGAIIGDYYDRPARVIMADRLATALQETIADPWLRSLDLIGSIDQVVDNTDVLSDPQRCRRLAPLYEGGASSSAR